MQNTRNIQRLIREYFHNKSNELIEELVQFQQEEQLQFLYQKLNKIIQRLQHSNEEMPLLNHKHCKTFLNPGQLRQLLKLKSLLLTGIKRINTTAATNTRIKIITVETATVITPPKTTQVTKKPVAVVETTRNKTRKQKSKKKISWVSLFFYQHFHFFMQR